jgi:hypothetical protein
MEMEDLIGNFVTEVARRSADHLAARAGPARVCSHCRNDLEEFSMTIPCCGRVLCCHCATRSVVYRWKTRLVVVCDYCRTAHTFEMTY